MHVPQHVLHNFLLADHSLLLAALQWYCLSGTSHCFEHSPDALAGAGTPTGDGPGGASIDEAAQGHSCREQPTPEIVSSLPRIGPKTVAAKACCWTSGSATVASPLAGSRV